MRQEKRLKKRIVITGLGVISSIGIGRDTFWKNLLKGTSGISKVTAFDTSKHATHVGGEVKNFKPEDFISKNRIKFTGRASQLAIAATKLALEDALLTKESSNYRTSVCLGTTMGEIQSVEKADYASDFQEDHELDPDLVTALMLSSKVLYEVQGPQLELLRKKVRKAIAGNQWLKKGVSATLANVITIRQDRRK